MKLLILFGPPAVGKTTVGTILEQKSNYKLFHNHMATDGVMHLFGVGTPTEDRLSKLIRSNIIKEAAAANMDLILTYVWNFDKTKGKENIDTYKKIYEEKGGEVIFVELAAPVEIRKERAASADRYQHKAHAPDPERVQILESQLNFKSPLPFYYPQLYHFITTTNKSPDQVADEILELL